MKSKLFIFFILLLIGLRNNAQTPNAFKYQAVVRDNNGQAIANKLVTIKLSLLINSANGTEVYSETHTIATNDFGVANLVVGAGNANNGNFNTIDWGAGTYFLKTEIDVNNGNNFSFLGTSQLLSVPYALYAGKSANAANDFDKDSINEIQNIALNGNNLTLSKNGGNVDLTKLDKDSQQLVLNGNTLSITNGNSLQLNDIDSLNEIQKITLTGNNLQLSKNGGNVDLTKLDKDSQQLVLNGNTLSITRGNSIVLSSAVDLDADPTNEIQNLSLVNDTLKISKANFIKLPKDNDSDSTNEIQTLNYRNDTISISNSNLIVLPKDLDRDSVNEIQQLTVLKNKLYLSKANNVNIDADTTNELQNLTYSNDTLKISKANNIYLPNMPAGSIIAYGGRNIPNGWLLCDGSTVNRAQFANLFAAIDSVWGNGNGNSTFHLPDLRGQFLRGVSGTSSVDPDTSSRTAKYNAGNIGNNVGSYQNDELKSHNHIIGQIGNPNINGSSYAAASWPTNMGYTQNTGGNETRPKNAYVYYIIKY